MHLENYHHHKERKYEPHQATTTPRHVTGSEQPITPLTPEMTRRYISLDHRSFEDLYTIIQYQDEVERVETLHDAPLHSKLTTKDDVSILPKLSSERREHRLSMDNFRAFKKSADNFGNGNCQLGTSPKSAKKELPILPRLSPSSAEKRVTSPPLRRHSSPNENKGMVRLPLNTVSNEQNIYNSTASYRQADTPLTSRIKDFMTKEIPGKPPSSLRYFVPKKTTNEQNTFAAVTKLAAHSLAINTSTCPNLQLHSDRSKWSYTHKPGKCRYLRRPQSPILQPDEIFSEW